MKHSMKFLLALAPIALLAACGGGDDDLDDRLDIADPKVRFVHAIPAGPDVTLFRGANAQSDATDVPYLFASKYFDVDSGDATWSVKTSTGSLDVGSVTFDAKRGNKYSLLAVPSSSVTEMVLIDDPYNKGLTADNARVRVFNASFNAGSIDVYLNAPGTDLAGVSPTFPAVAYKAASPASGSDSVDLPGGTYQMRITNAGTKNVIFNAPVTLNVNADWLVLSLPASATPDDVKALVVQSDDDTPAATELTTTP